MKVKIYYNLHSACVWAEGKTYELATGKSWKQDGRSIKGKGVIQANISKKDWESKTVREIYKDYSDQLYLVGELVH